jgi:osmotically-inducible protein OsmY
MKMAAALVLLCGGCKARDGDILAQVARKTGQKIGGAVGDGPNRLASSLPGSVGEAGIAIRVTNRLRWDRYLAKLDVEVETTAPGAVTLRGKVPDRSIKQRILDLAKSTIGVERVEDQLTLPEKE